MGTAKYRGLFREVGIEVRIARMHALHGAIVVLHDHQPAWSHDTAQLRQGGQECAIGDVL